MGLAGRSTGDRGGNSGGRWHRKGKGTRQPWGRKNGESWKGNRNRSMEITTVSPKREACVGHQCPHHSPWPRLEAVAPDLRLTDRDPTATRGPGRLEPAGVRAGGEQNSDLDEGDLAQGCKARGVTEARELNERIRRSIKARRRVIEGQKCARAALNLPGASPGPCLRDPPGRWWHSQSAQDRWRMYSS